MGLVAVGSPIKQAANNVTQRHAFGGSGMLRPMEALRTPDSAFEDLPGYGFSPNYVDIADGLGSTLRMHYVDEGPSEGAPILLLHGQPAWSYLYRKMIPGLVAAGHRVIAPDLVGFGKSDKPLGRESYTYTRHVGWVEEFIRTLDLNGVTLFGQDWGSLIGLAVAARNGERFDRIVIANGALPDPRKAEAIATAVSKSSNPGAFAQWQKFVAASDELDIPGLMKTASAMGESIDGYEPSPISDAEAAAYGAPFPDKTFQGGALAFPSLVASQGEDDDVMAIFTAAWDELERWDKPFLCLFGKADPMLGNFDEVFIAFVPGAAGLPHREFAGVGHFIQEEIPDELVAAVNGLIAST